MPQEILNSQTEMEPINAGSFQEFDYNNEDFECEWRQQPLILKENHCVVNDCTHDWGG